MPKKITIIPGDGIGPSLIESTIKVLDQLDCDFEYEYVDAGITAIEKHNETIPSDDNSFIGSIEIKTPDKVPAHV